MLARPTAPQVPSVLLGVGVGIALTWQSPGRGAASSGSGLASTRSEGVRTTWFPCPNSSYEFEPHRWEGAHGDICRSRENRDVWVCPVGCHRSRRSPFCVRPGKGCPAASLSRRAVSRSGKSEATELPYVCQCHVYFKAERVGRRPPLAWVRAPAVPGAATPVVPTALALSCLRNRWIYCIGDSSMRMYFKALLEVLAPGFADSRFGSFTELDKGGCSGGVRDKTVKGGLRGEEEYGDKGGGCLREYFDHENGIRVTFSFKTFARQQMKAEEWLVSGTQVPDLFLTATGAWDLTYRTTMKQATPEEAAAEGAAAAAWAQGMASMYPESPLLTMTLNSCHAQFRDIALRWNAALHGNTDPHTHPTVALLDREPATIVVTNTSMCEGWHAFGSIVLQQVHASLGALCPSSPSS